MQRIAESELIINSRGAIYHLDLLPEEIAHTIITVGDPDRVGMVSRHFDKIDVKRQHREFISHTGTIGNKRITAISTGIGPDNIDIVINELDALVNIDFETRYVKEELTHLNIIRIGTSGALQADIPVDSYVASTHGLGLDNLLNFYRHDHNEEEKQLLQSLITHTHLHAQITQPYIATASPALLKHFVNNFHQGITVTCPGFYGPQGRILRLGIKSPELINRLTHFSFGQHRITNFEMETSGIYGLGKMLGHHCLSLSAIVANRVQMQFSKDGNAAVERLITLALENISSLPLIMHLHFFKYQGTGNDFVIMDNRSGELSGLTTEQVKFLCDRRFGIGGDGLMLLNNHKNYDFEMKYYNSDGRESSMCGNGGRCLVKFAHDLGLMKTTYKFIAVDGPHEAEVKPDGTVALKMNDVTLVKKVGRDYVLDTGSPHFVHLANDVMRMDVYKKGREIRHSNGYKEKGINVNFVEHLPDTDKIIVRTYERGVEDETLSCGTGVTAAALVCYHNDNGFNHVQVQTKGGTLSVDYDKIGNSFQNIWLSGPAQKVFEGTIDL